MENSILSKENTQISEKLSIRISDYFNKVYKIPIRFSNNDFTSLSIQGKENYKDFIKSGNSLFITGGVGIGKTHLAIALAKELFIGKLKTIDGRLKISKINIIFKPVTELFLELKRSFDTLGNNEIDILDELDRSDLLIIDDIGTDKVSDWSKQIIYTIIDRRYRNMKQMIITSNLSLDEFANIYDDRIASRLIEMGEIIRLKGNDKRKTSHKYDLKHTC